MRLQKILEQYNLSLIDSDGKNMDAIQFLETLYRKVTPRELNFILHEIEQAEMEWPIFEEAKGKALRQKYKENS